MLLRKLLSYRKLACIISLLLIASSASAANVLTNPGFEAGDFTGWTVGGNSYSNGVDTNGSSIPGADYTSYVITRSGNYAGYAAVDNDTPPHRITLTQTVSVPPHQDIQVGFWMGCKSDNDSFGVAIGDDNLQIFVDGVGLLSPDLFAFSSCNAGEYREISSSFNTGANNSIQVTYAITGSGTSSAGFSFDDFYVNALEAPTPIAVPTMTQWGMIIFVTLAGLGGIYFIRRNKITES